MNVSIYYLNKLCRFHDTDSSNYSKTAAVSGKSSSLTMSGFIYSPWLCYYYYYYYYYFAIVDVKGKRLLKKATLRGIGDIRGK